MRNHHFNNTDPNGLCTDVYDQVPCNLRAADQVHMFLTGEFDRAEISIEVFVNRDKTGRGGQHYATIAWQREANGDWYSAWFAPASSSVYHRVDKLDTLSTNLIGLHVNSVLRGEYSEDDLRELGITNKSVVVD